MVNIIEEITIAVHANALPSKLCFIIKKRDTIPPTNVIE